MFSSIGKRLTFIDISKSASIIVGKEISIIACVVFWLGGYC